MVCLGFMAETTPSQDLSTVHEAQGPYHITFWAAHKEFDVVPVSSLGDTVNYPGMGAEGEALEIPRGLEIYRSLRPATAPRGYEDLREIHDAVGASSMTLLELTRAIDSNMVDIWPKVTRITNALPDKIFHIAANDVIRRRRIVTLGDFSLTAVQRRLTDAERELREPYFRGNSDEAIMATQARRTAYHFEKSSVQEREIGGIAPKDINHAIVNVDGKDFFLDTKTPTGLLGLRVLDAFYGVKLNPRAFQFPYVVIRDFLWKSMLPEDRAPFVNDIEKYYSGNSFPLNPAINHVLNTFAAFRPNREAPPLVERRARHVTFLRDRVALKPSEEPLKAFRPPSLSIPPFKK